MSIKWVSSYNPVYFVRIWSFYFIYNRVVVLFSLSLSLFFFAAEIDAVISHKSQITCLINRVDAFSSRLLQSRSDNKQAANTLGQTGDKTVVRPMTCFCIFDLPI